MNWSLFKRKPHPFHNAIRVAWGLEDYWQKGPIAPMPEGLVKIRRRPTDKVKLFAKHGDCIRSFYLKFESDHWVPVLIAENKRVDSMNPAKGEI